MQTRLTSSIADTPEGMEADAILRSCVHCGFCLATCPTYQLLGDEDDSPRGRIYLIKAVLEGHTPTADTRTHLDRCLTCRACETTCPSGVNYHRLLDIGRTTVEEQAPRPVSERLLRGVLARVLPDPRLFNPLLRLGQWARPLLPAILRDKIPAAGVTMLPLPTRMHRRRIVLLEGCVQPALAPGINRATIRVLDKLGIGMEPVEGAGCCGALRHHLSAQEGARRDMRRNIDAWVPALERGAEAIVINASGCAPQVKDYATLLADDTDYADRAREISARALDLAEVLAAEEASLRAALMHSASPLRGRKVAFHSPCTLQHGQGITGVVERLLIAAGCELQPVANAHLCCGSAGTYSLLQPELAGKLRTDKLEALEACEPDEIATANIGCLSHLQGATTLPVRHWIELIDEALGE